MNLYERYLESNEVILNENKESGLFSVKYQHLGVDWKNPDNLIARGLIINKSGEIIARPYDKFFGYHQFGVGANVSKKLLGLTSWHEDLAYIADKSDGSLVIAYTYKDELFLSSSGSVHSNHSDLFFELLETYPKETETLLTELGKDYTILMEYVGPENQVVLEYKTTEFILHGIRNTKTGEYLNWSEVSKIAHNLSIKIAEIYKDIFTIDEVLNSLEGLKNKEGFVAVFKDGYRLKFKTEDYVELHLTLMRFNTRKNVRVITDHLIHESIDDVMSLALTNEKSPQFKTTQLFFDTFLLIVNEYNNIVNEIKRYLIENNLSEISKKEQVEIILNDRENLKAEPNRYFSLLSSINNLNSLTLTDLLKTNLGWRMRFENEVYDRTNEKEEE